MFFEQKVAKLILIGAIITLPAFSKSKKVGPTADDLSHYLSQDNKKAASDSALKQADDLRLKTINSIKKLAEGKMKKSQKFELYLRLGELYSERHDYIRELEVRRFEAEHDAWQKKEKAKRGKEPKLRTKESRNALYKSVATFRKLVKDYPRHPRTDAAMFSLAKSLARLNNDNAIIYFNKLIKKYKNSQFLPEAYLALGEHHFYKQKFEEAKDYYQSALKYRNSKIYTYAVYKLGWTYFNQSTGSAGRKRAIDKAIAAFKLVVKLSERDKSKVGGFNLKQEAINDLIIVFAEDQRTDEALAYFVKIDENRAFYDMLERMGNLYVENGETQKAIMIFTRLLTEAPTRIRNPEIYLTLISLHDNKGNLNEVVKNLEKMKSLFVEVSDWTKENIRVDKDKVAEASKKTQKNIHRYGTLYHKTGMSGNRKHYLTASLKLYNLYLSSFPKAEESYELRYYMAEVHFHFGNFDKAADEYFRVSKLEGKYRKKAAIAAVASMKNIVDRTVYDKLPPLGQVGSPIEIPATKLKYIGMLDNFVSLLPDDKKGHPMRYTAAYTLFEYGHYDPSLKRFEAIVREIPKTNQGKSSVKMIMGYYTEKKQWDELISFCRTFLKNKNIVNTNLQKTLQNTLRDSLFGQAVRYSKQNDHLNSAKAFVAYQQEFPKAKNADDALYNATLSYYKDGKVGDAISKGKVLIKMYPKSKHIRKTILDIAQSYETLADFQQAAEYYEKYARAFPKSRKSSVTLYNAATLFKGLKKNKKAIALYKRFRKFYPKDKLASQAIFELASLYEKQKDYNNAVKYYQKHAWSSSVNSETYLYSLAKSAEIQFNHGNKKSARSQFQKLYNRLVKENSKPAFDARRIVARSMFSDLNDEFTKFKREKISSAKNIERDVKRKQNMLNSITKKYQRIVDLGSGEFTVASLFRVAEMNEFFADALLSAPAPKGATQLAVDQYRSSIEKVALPLREEAEKYYELAYQRSREVQTFTNWTRLAREKMSQLDEKKYPLVNERNVEASYLSHRLQWQEEVSKLGN